MILAVVSFHQIYAQEVRGIETRRITYEGPEYICQFSSASHNEYYGWELVNRNSIRVSVDIELWCHDVDNAVVKTQTIILKPGEKYVFKREEHQSTHVDCYGYYHISNYYVKYKAFKMQ